MVDIMRLCSASNAFIIPKIFNSYNFCVISNRKLCGNCLISLTISVARWRLSKLRFGAVISR